jgi:hypothetical protein
MGLRLILPVNPNGELILEPTVNKKQEVLPFNFDLARRTPKNAAPYSQHSSEFSVVATSLDSQELLTGAQFAEVPMESRGFRLPAARFPAPATRSKASLHFL